MVIGQKIFYIAEEFGSKELSVRLGTIENYSEKSGKVSVGSGDGKHVYRLPNQLFDDAATAWQALFADIEESIKYNKEKYEAAVNRKAKATEKYQVAAGGAWAPPVAATQRS